MEQTEQFEGNSENPKLDGKAQATEVENADKEELKEINRRRNEEASEGKLAQTNAEREEMTHSRRIEKSNYKQYVFEKMPKSSHWKNMFWAFLVGGLICVVGQGFIEMYKAFGIPQEDSSVLASGTLVLVAALMTGFGFYDSIGRFAGAGSTIPITGFSNAVVAPALEFRSEGYIYGIGAKMFQVAGPVIVNGVTFAVLIATIRLVLGGL